MKKYLALTNCAGTKVFKSGDVLELSSKEAKELLEADPPAIKPMDAPKKAKAKAEPTEPVKDQEPDKVPNSEG